MEKKKPEKPENWSTLLNDLGNNLMGLGCLIMLLFALIALIAFLI